jgi:hypothetical protein
MAAIDFAHCKGMKGRFESLGNSTGEPICHYSYGAAPAAKFGKVERPESARHMLGFQNVCRSELPTPPASSSRDVGKHQGLVLQSREIQLDNVIARAGI